MTPGEFTFRCTAALAEFRQKFNTLPSVVYVGETTCSTVRAAMWAGECTKLPATVRLDYYIHKPESFLCLHKNGSSLIFD